MTHEYFEGISTKTHKFKAKKDTLTPTKFEISTKKYKKRNVDVEIIEYEIKD
ncbi:hypothetical protein [Methanobacterium formicicum]|jgi:hypothetical protein|uniref:hypothetical protein n=1 Tax=Methanobacterium formicicum TaxID=2162 RepID=UPI002412CD49|nr:hypothetical protein [Methanobacterium formicicum]MDG3547049.1 hypothetical protein [Methanobacterium formicicum]